MAEATKFNATGSKSGSATLDDAMFGITPNVPVMHQVVTNQLAARRAGTQSTKTRSEVRGGGAKPYRQKGTGNARQGSIRSPQYSGGGVALGPKPRKYGKKTPKKMIRLALRSALSDRAVEGKILVVDSWAFDKPSTKAAQALLGKMGVDGSTMVVIDRDDINAALSFRNLPNVQIVEPAELNAYDILVNEYIIFTEANLPTSEAVVQASEAQEPSVEAKESVVEEAEADADPATENDEEE